MRYMGIPPFPNVIDITDLANFYKARLGTTTICLGNSAAILLLGYMIAPNDAVARDEAVDIIQTWLKGGQKGLLPLSLRTVQQHWTRLTDIFQLHHAIAEGDHQKYRGGASV